MATVPTFCGAPLRLFRLPGSTIAWTRPGDCGERLTLARKCLQFAT
jgi:hypothetical protein